MSKNAEVVEQNQNKQITKNDVLPPDFQERIDEAKRQNQALMELMDELLQEGVDYGKEKGIPKPFLHQPGAQQLGVVFKFRPVFKKVDSDINFDTDPIFISYEYKCQLYQRESGELLGEGVGSCNNYEKKYRYHSDGTTFEDPLDRQNTLMKMAKKRAYVDATLNVTGATRLFTQDQDLVKTQNKDEIPDEAGEVKINGGQYKGTKIKNINDEDYLNWVAENWNDEDIRQAAEDYLNQDGKENQDNQSKLSDRQKEIIKFIKNNDGIKKQDISDFLEDMEAETVDELEEDNYKQLLDLLDNMTMSDEEVAEEAAEDMDIDSDNYDTSF